MEDMDFCPLIDLLPPTYSLQCGPNMLDSKKSITEEKLGFVSGPKEVSHCQLYFALRANAPPKAREAFGKQIVSDAAQYGVYVGVTKMPYIELPESTVAEARWSLVPPSGTDSAGRRDAKSSATTPQLHLTLEAGPVVMVCFMATPSLIEYSC